jgi:hypothetical protein
LVQAYPTVPAVAPLAGAVLDRGFELVGHLAFPNKVSSEMNLAAMDAAT